MTTQMSWKDLKFWQTEAWKSIKTITKNLEDKKSLVPPRKFMLRPLSCIRINNVRVVMLFEEPYSNRRITDGIPLSMPIIKSYEPWKVPYFNMELALEMQNDVGVKVPRKQPSFDRWFKQGILMWYSRATTVNHNPRSHIGLGWETLTKEILETTYLLNPRTVFVLFGKTASYLDCLPDDAHVVLVPMPDPTNLTKFRGQKPFSRINAALKATRQRPINWSWR